MNVGSRGGLCSVDLPSLQGVGKFARMRADDVSTREPAIQRRERVPLLERGREPAASLRPGGAAPGVVSGGDQRQPASGVVQDAGRL